MISEADKKFGAATALLAAKAGRYTPVCGEIRERNGVVQYHNKIARHLGSGRCVKLGPPFLLPNHSLCHICLGQPTLGTCATGPDRDEIVSCTGFVILAKAHSSSTLQP